MAITIDFKSKSAAVLLTSVTYTDEEADTPENDEKQKREMTQKLAQIPAESNGPYTLLWGPTTNNGILVYVAQGADNSYAVAFRGSLSSESDPVGFFQNWADDLLALTMVPWKYPYNNDRHNQAKVSSGMNDAIALGIAATDRDTGVTLIDFLRSQISKEPGSIMTTGHSLGGAMANLMAVWLVDQLPRAGGPKGVNVVPFTFAAPTVTESNFAEWFQQVCPISYHCVNRLDIVPMAWANLDGNDGITSFYPDGPSLFGFSKILYLVIKSASLVANGLGYTTLNTGTMDYFEGQRSQNQVSFSTEASMMHSLQNMYQTHVIPQHR